MFAYLVRRLFYAVLTVWAVSIVSFVIIQLPPGDYVTAYLAQLSVQGSTLGMSEADNLRAYYGLDRPLYYQYYLWLERMVQGDFGYSFEHQKPVKDVIGERLLLTIDGLEKALKQCNKVEALTVKQTVVKLESGNARIYEIEPGKLEFPNLVFTVPESHAEPLIKWHERFVLEGKNEQTEEKTGSLTFLAPNLKDELGEIKFTGIGIFNISADKGEAGNETIRRVKVECYVEDLKFKPSTSFTKRF